MNADVLAPLGGVELNSLQVAQDLRRRGHHIDLLYRQGGSQSPQWRTVSDSMRRVPAFRLRKRRPVRDVLNVAPSLYLARKLRPDVLYLNRAELLPWGVLAAKAAGAPLVCHLHHYPDFAGIGRLAGATARFVAVSAFVKRSWVDAGVPADKVDVVHNGVSPEAYRFAGEPELLAARANLGIPRDAVVFLYYGRFNRDKGVHILLRAWAELRRRVDSAVLVMLGDFPDDETGAGYERQLVQLGLDQALRFGNRADVLPFLAASDVVVLPAEWDEPFGRVVIEAMMTGRPVAATRSGGIPEILTGEFAGWVVDKGDPAALCEALAGLSRWRTDDPDLGRRACTHVQQRFGLEAAVSGVEAILQLSSGTGP
jgi:glycosyltransferase involved in cell wall biosynthesis